jgi:hypothetical protein
MKADPVEHVLGRERHEVEDAFLLSDLGCEHGNTPGKRFADVLRQPGRRRDDRAGPRAPSADGIMRRAADRVNRRRAGRRSIAAAQAAPSTAAAEAAGPPPRRRSPGERSSAAGHWPTCRELD